MERFEADTVSMGPRSRVPVVRVHYRDGFDTAHEATSLPGKALGVDEHYVMPGYGNLDNGAAHRAPDPVSAPVRRVVAELAGRLLRDLRPTVRLAGAVAAILWP